VTLALLVDAQFEYPHFTLVLKFTFLNFRLDIVVAGGCPARNATLPARYAALTLTRHTVLRNGLIVVSFLSCSFSLRLPSRAAVAQRLGDTLHLSVVLGSIHSRGREFFVYKIFLDVFTFWFFTLLRASEASECSGNYSDLVALTSIPRLWFEGCLGLYIMRTHERSECVSPFRIERAR